MRRVMLIATLLVASCASGADARDCTHDQGRVLVGDEDIRHAVNEDETIVISAKGSRAVCGATQQVVAPPPEPSLTIPFAQQSAAVPETMEPDLQRVVQQARAIGARLRIAAVAYAENASYAARLAYVRAEAVRSALVSFGARSDAIELKARGGIQGIDRVDLDLIASARGPPSHG